MSITKKINKKGKNTSIKEFLKKPPKKKGIFIRTISVHITRYKKRSGKSFWKKGKTFHSRKKTSPLIQEKF